MAWIKTAEKKPEEYTLVLGTDGHGYVLVVWHPTMGHDGDFATVTSKKRTTTLHHCPGIVAWTSLPSLPSAKSPAVKS